MRKKVCHISTVHPSFDDRIFYKECQSLKKNGFEVHLLAQNNKHEIVDGIYIHALPKPKNRIERFFNLRKIAFQEAIKINADIYHFHDPELIPLGLKLKKLGKIVIYDVHEDVPRQILNKEYLPSKIRPVISKLFEYYELKTAKKFDAIITATPYIKNRFEKINPNTVDINNFPKLDELYEPVSWFQRKNEICYIGSISKNRGIVEIIKALEYVNTTLHLAGNFISEDLKREVMQLPGWKKVKYYGFVDRSKVKEILKKVKIGIVILHPIPNYLNSLPVKMFEYMSVGIPIIASNFPLWKAIIEKNKCGICVNPYNPKEIANTINFLLKNENIAMQYGFNGRKLVENEYNWSKEEKKLLELYEKLVNI